MELIVKTNPEYYQRIGTNTKKLITYCLRRLKLKPNSNA